MLRDLLDTTLAYAERADRPVQAAIWLRAARVMAKVDRSSAERLIERGVETARRFVIDETGLTGSYEFQIETEAPSATSSAGVGPRATGRKKTAAGGRSLPMWSQLRGVSPPRPVVVATGAAGAAGGANVHDAGGVSVVGVIFNGVTLFFVSKLLKPARSTPSITFHPLIDAVSSLHAFSYVWIIA